MVYQTLLAVLIRNKYRVPVHAYKINTMTSPATVFSMILQKTCFNHTPEDTYTQHYTNNSLVRLVQNNAISDAWNYRLLHWLVHSEKQFNKLGNTFLARWLPVLCFLYFANPMAYGKSVLDFTCVFDLSLLLLFDALFTPIKYSTGYTCDENRNTCGFTQHVCYGCKNLIKTGAGQHHWVQLCNIKFKKVCSAVLM